MILATSRGVTANSIISPGFPVGFVGDARLDDFPEPAALRQAWLYHP
jgi:hypothetical protein